MTDSLTEKVRALRNAHQMPDAWPFPKRQQHKGPGGRPLPPPAKSARPETPDVEDTTAQAPARK